MKAQMRYANNLGASYVVIVGDREVEQGLASVKSLAEGGSQDEVSLRASSIAGYLENPGNQ